MLNNLNFTKENVFIHLEFINSTEVLQYLSQSFEEREIVNESFFKALIKREKTYPTGLETAVPIAIPHVAEGIIKPFLSIMTLKKPVFFKDMAGSGKDIPVEIVIMFGNNSNDQQTEILQKLSLVMQDEKKLRELLNYHSRNDLHRAFIGMIDEK